MRRFGPLLAAILALAFAGCANNGQDDQGVGPGPGPSARRVASYDSIPDGLGGSIKVARKIAYAPEDGNGLPAGAFFDNSRADRAALRDAVRAPGFDPRASRTAALAAPAVARYTAPSRRDTLESRGVPAPATTADLALARPDPATGGSVIASLQRFERSTYQAASEIFSRTAWGATRPASAAPMHPSRVTIHHTDGNRPESLAGAISEMRGIQSFHKSKWADIGYHFVLDGEGRVFEGRHTEILGAHVGAANWNNVGIALMGNYDKQQVSEGQKTSLRRLVTFLAVRYKADTRARDFIQGHMHYMSTDCPGRNTERYLPQLRSEVIGEVDKVRSNNGATNVAFTPLGVVSQS